MTLVSENQALLTRETQVADLGELAGPLTHEFNNLLNNLALHLEIVKLKAPNDVAADFETLRYQIGQAAAQIACFQRYRRAASTGDERSDLNAAANHAVEALLENPPKQTTGLPLRVRQAEEEKAAEPGVATIDFERQESLPPVRGHVADLQRVCRFLLNNAVRAVAVRGGNVRLRTMRQGELTQLVVEDDGPDIPPSSWTSIFEPGNDCREGMCCLELAACRSIMRRLRGRIEARGRPEGGLALTASFVE